MSAEDFTFTFIVTPAAGADPVDALNRLGAIWSPGFDAYASGQLDASRVRCALCLPAVRHPRVLRPARCPARPEPRRCVMGCKGLHCDGCGHGGGGAAAVIALLVIIAVALRKAWPQIVHAVDIAAWTVAGITGAAILITGGVLTARAVRGSRARHAIRQATYHATVIPAARLTERPTTIEAPA